MPYGESAMIGFPRSWQILHEKSGLHGEWTGEFATPDDALAAIAGFDPDRLLPFGYQPSRGLVSAVESREVDYAGHTHRLVLSRVEDYPAAPMPARHVRITAMAERPDGRREFATVGMDVDKLRDPDYVADRLTAAMKSVLDGSLRPGERHFL
jgi:hypothetical protein